MIYELFITNKCNRKCSFCYIKQGNYLISKSQIDDFYDIVLKETNGDYFQLNLFGGEPLLYIETINYILNKFTNENCDIHLVTNGDYIDRLIKNDNIEKLNITLSCYDIFENQQKYITIISDINVFKSICLTFTFDQSNIDKIDEYVKFCKNYDVCYKITFSHDIKSWDKTSRDELYCKVYDIVQKEFRSKINGFPHSEHIDKYIKKLQQYLYQDESQIKSHFCVTDDKKVFYDGKFIGSCIRFLYKKVPELKNIKPCVNCDLEKICSKSCVAEYVNGCVPEKLCTIERASFDALMEFGF